MDTVFDYQNLLISARAVWESEWNNSDLNLEMFAGFDSQSMNPILTYISESKPSTIIEYGSGESTFVIQEFLKEIQHNCNFISFEDDEVWYNKVKSGNLISDNTVVYAPLEPLNFEFEGNNYYCNRYSHSYENITLPVFVIVNGPDLGKLEPRPESPLNLYEIYNLYGSGSVDYFIHGSGAIQHFYKKIGYGHYKLNNEVGYLED